MTAIITPSTDITADPLAAAASVPMPGRVTAGGFDLLIALLQGVLAAPAPTLPGAAAPTSGGPAADPRAVDAPALAPAPRVPLISSQLAATLSIGASGECLHPLGEDDRSETHSTPASASLLFALAPPQGPVLASVPTVAVREPDGVAPGPQNPQPVAHASAALVNTMRAAAPPMPTGAEAAMPAEVEQAVAPMAAPGERSRPLPARSVDALHARHAEAAPETFTGNGMARTGLDAPPPSARPVVSLDNLPRADPFPSREGDAAATLSSDGAGSGVSAAAPAMAERMVFENDEPTRLESARPDPVDQVVTRLRELRTPGRHEISVRLDPPELGGVQIDARIEGSRVHVQIRAEHAPTGELLTDALPRIRETLAQQGFAPGDVSVHLGLDGSPRHSARDSAPSFTPPRDSELSPPPRIDPVTARAVAATDGLDVWA